MRTESAPSPIADGRSWMILIAGFVAAWLVLDQSAQRLQSFRGESGLWVCLLTLGALVAIEWLGFRRRPLDALRALGLEAPNRTGVLIVAVVCAILIAFFPAYAVVTGTAITLTEDWPLLLLGIAFQAGLAEETLFRGYLFGHIRQGRSFWRAALLAAMPFIAVHLLLFVTMDFAVALAALMLSVSIGFPCAALYERSGRSIWPPALLHCVVQGAIKIVVVPGEAFTMLALGWMVFAGIAPWLVFLWPQRRVNPAAIQS